MNSSNILPTFVFFRHPKTLEACEEATNNDLTFRKKVKLLKKFKKSKMENPLLLSSGLNVGQVEKMQMDAEAAKHGLSVVTAALFLAGEMAGSGVLALPNAMIGTGKQD